VRDALDTPSIIQQEDLDAALAALAELQAQAEAAGAAERERAAWEKHGQEETFARERMTTALEAIRETPAPPHSSTPPCAGRRGVESLG